jgi:predicted TIM-barrel fold metal-dependent hydrolase
VNAPVDPRVLPLAGFEPRSRVVVPETPVDRPRFPAVDAHNHLGRWLTGDWCVPDVGALLELMDEAGVEAVVNLDGRFGDELEANLDRYDRSHPGRFVTFCHVDFELAREPGFEARLVAALRDGHARGARGLKVWKDLGLGFRDPAGELLLPDDPRLGALFHEAGELGLPVLIHTADPVAFFDPVDHRNERLEELGVHPEWSFAGPAFPSFDRLMEALEALVAAHPGTSFIAAHAGCHAEDLSHVGRLLATYPNLTIDFSARIAELGRQPRAAAALFRAHPTRILFGTDRFPPDLATYRRYYRFLETADEHFGYDTGDGVPSQGRWAISALDLGDDVLRAIYRDTPRRVLHLEETDPP